MKLECLFRDPFLLKRLIATFDGFFAQSNWDFSETGVDLTALDSAHVALVQLHLEPSAFENYTCPRHVSLGIHLESVAKVLSCVSKTTYVSLMVDDTADVLRVLIEGKNQVKITRLSFLASHWPFLHPFFPTLRVECHARLQYQVNQH